MVKAGIHELLKMKNYIIKITTISISSPRSG